MTTLSSPRFGAIYTVVGPKEELVSAQKALEEKAQAQKIPVFIRRGPEFDWAYYQRIKVYDTVVPVTPKGGKPTGAYLPVRKISLEPEPDDMKQGVLKLYTGKRDSALAAWSHWFHHPKNLLENCLQRVLTWIPDRLLRSIESEQKGEASTGVLTLPDKTPFVISTQKAQEPDFVLRI